MSCYELHHYYQVTVRNVYELVIIVGQASLTIEYGAIKTHKPQASRIEETIIKNPDCTVAA